MATNVNTRPCAFCSEPVGQFEEGTIDRLGFRVIDKNNKFPVTESLVLCKKHADELLNRIEVSNE